MRKFFSIEGFLVKTALGCFYSLVFYTCLVPLSVLAEQKNISQQLPELVASARATQSSNLISVNYATDLFVNLSGQRQLTSQERTMVDGGFSYVLKNKGVNDSALLKSLLPHSKSPTIKRYSSALDLLSPERDDTAVLKQIFSSFLKNTARPDDLKELNKVISLLRQNGISDDALRLAVQRNNSSGVKYRNICSMPNISGEAKRICLPKEAVKSKRMNLGEGTSVSLLLQFAPPSPALDALKLAYTVANFVYSETFVAIGVSNLTYGASAAISQALLSFGLALETVLPILTIFVVAVAVVAILISLFSGSGPSKSEILRKTFDANLNQCVNSKLQTETYVMRLLQLQDNFVQLAKSGNLISASKAKSIFASIGSLDSQIKSLTKDLQLYDNGMVRLFTKAEVAQKRATLTTEIAQRSSLADLVMDRLVVQSNDNTTDICGGLKNTGGDVLRYNAHSVDLKKALAGGNPKVITPIVIQATQDLAHVGVKHILDGRLQRARDDRSASVGQARYVKNLVAEGYRGLLRPWVVTLKNNVAYLKKVKALGALDSDTMADITRLFGELDSKSLNDDPSFILQGFEDGVPLPIQAK